MRLTNEMIERMSKKAAKVLLDGGQVIWEDTPEKLEGIINHVITQDLMVEDQLNDEVKTLLESRTKDYERDMMDFSRVFQMVKQKLVRERGLIL